METLAQIAFIAFCVIGGASGFYVIGDDTSGTQRTKGAAWGVIIYGTFSVAIAMTWETPDTATLIAKISVFVLMWVPWLDSLRHLNKPSSPVTSGTAIWNAITCAAMCTAALVYWI